MTKKHSGVEIATILDSPEAIAKWKADPLACLEDAGISLSRLDLQTKQALNKRLANTDPKALTVSSGCTVCIAAVTATLAGLTVALGAAIAALLVGSEGADTPAIPEELAGAEALTAEAIAAETGVPVTVVTEITTSVITDWFVWILAHPWKAAAMLASGTLILGIYAAIAYKVCQKSGACS